MKSYRDIAGDGGSNIAGQVAAQQVRLRARLAPVRSTLAIVSGKGGVGKSSLTANLAVALAARGRLVGVLDADLNGPSMAKMLVSAAPQHLRHRRAVQVGVEPRQAIPGTRQVQQ